MKTRASIAAGLIVSMALLFTLGARAQTPVTGPDKAAPGSQVRQGAWVDTVLFTAEGSPATAIARLQADEIDLYASDVLSPGLYRTVMEDPDLALTESIGNYTELTLNPYGPTFNDGRLNPLSNARIREALNWLIDREHIAQWIYGGLAFPKWLPIQPGSADDVRYQASVQALESAYAYDQAHAQQVITAEMQAMGASLVDGKWSYAGRPVTLIMLIRVEDERRQIGDYVAGQLESAGFAVDRQYKTRQEASAIWVDGDPADGLFHVYTGGWVSTRISRDGGADFSFFYTPHDYAIPLHQAYSPSTQFDTIALKLRDHDFADMEEREALFTQALALALNDAGSGSVRVWLVDETSFTARQADTVVTNDPVGGVSGSQMWPYVIRFESQEGGTVRAAQQALLVAPWNPVAGSAWPSDQMPIRATQDYGLLSDPVTGLARPQRAERAEVVALAGLPVTRTLDWVDLDSAPTIDVPADAWVDWDAAAQRFVTAGEKYPEGLTAVVKSTVYYPGDLFTTVTWHDGSPLDVADFVMNMILLFDRGKPQSAIYDPYDGAYAATWNAFMDHFLGLRITSTDPLIIETYDSEYQLDAELNVNAWWPNGLYGPAAWHNLALGVRAEAAGQLAFSEEKASSSGVAWMSWIGGDSLGILAEHLSQSAAESYVPYAPTLGLYVTPAEAAARWANVQAWHAARGHFWVGTGPFYLESADAAAGTVVLQHNPAFPDAAGRWDAFAAPSPQVTINYDSGAPGSSINVTGSGFPPGSTAVVLVNGETLGQQPVSASGTVSFTLSTEGAEEGAYHLVVRANPVAGARFTLDSAEPIRPQEGELPVLTVPPDLALHEVYLPTVLRAF